MLELHTWPRIHSPPRYFTLCWSPFTDRYNQTFFFSILTERFYTINYTTLNIFGDSYRLFSTFLQNPANHKNEPAIRKEDDPPYSHRTGSSFLQVTTQNLHPTSHPPKNLSTDWGGKWDLRTSSTPTHHTLHPSHFGNNTNTGFEGWKKKMTEPRGFAEENSLRNMLEPQLHTDSIEGRYCLKISSVFLKDINISLIEVM